MSDRLALYNSVTGELEVTLTKREYESLVQLEHTNKITESINTQMNICMESLKVRNKELEARCKELEGDKLALQILASELDKTIQVRAKTINELENKLEEIRINGDY